MIQFRENSTYRNTHTNSVWTCIAFSRKGEPVLQKTGDKDATVMVVTDKSEWVEHREPLEVLVYYHEDNPGKLFVTQKKVSNKTLQQYRKKGFVFHKCKEIL